jgi:hypothetical protein
MERGIDMAHHMDEEIELLSLNNAVLANEIKALKAQLAAEKEGHAAWENENLRQASEVEARLAECEKDAERYRFLKKGYGCKIELMEQEEEDGEYYGVCLVKGNYIDATIDAAIKAHKGESE